MIQMPLLLLLLAIYVFHPKINATNVNFGRMSSPCNGSVRLLVQCAALALRRQVDLGVECSGASVYVFTDKTVYTPGQTGKFQMTLVVAPIQFTFRLSVTSNCMSGLEFDKL